MVYPLKTKQTSQNNQKTNQSPPRKPHKGITEIFYLNDPTFFSFPTALRSAFLSLGFYGHAFLNSLTLPPS